MDNQTSVAFAGVQMTLVGLAIGVFLGTSAAFWVGLVLVAAGTFAVAATVW